MAIFDFSNFYDDDDEKKTPSQKAREQVKTSTEKKKNENVVFDFSDFKRKEPEQQPVQTQTTQTQQTQENKNIFQRAGSFVKNIFKNDEPEQLQELKKENLYEYTQLSTVPVLQKRIMEIDKKLDTGLPQKSDVVPDIIPVIPEEKIANAIVGWATGNKTQAQVLLGEREYLKRLIDGDVSSLAYQKKQLDEGKITQEEYNNQLANLRVQALNTIKGQSKTSQVGVGVAETTASTIDFGQLIGDKFGKKGLSETSEKKSEELRAWSQTFQKEDPDFSDSLLQGFGSTLPFILLGGAIGKVAQGVARVSPSVASWFAAGSSGALEAGTEAGALYVDLKKEGKDQKEAQKRADALFIANVGWNIFLNRFGLNSEEAIGLKRLFYSASMESIQEMGQAFGSNLAGERPLDEGVIESGLVGFVVGGGFASVTGSENAPSDPIVTPKKADEIISKSSNLQQKEEEKTDLPDAIKQELTVPEPKPRDKRETISVTKDYDGAESAYAVIRKDGTGAISIKLDEYAQGKGLGTEIVQDLENKLRENDVYQVELSAFEEAVGFWEKQGYVAGEKTGTNVKMSKTLEQRVEQLEETQKQTKQEADIRDANRQFNEETTRKTIDQTLSGERESFRIDSEANIKKYTQGFGEAKPSDTVMVYRAGKSEIKSGDFVTVSDTRAEQVYMKEREGAELLSKEVKISDLVHGGGLKSEFVFAPKEEVGTRKTELTKKQSKAPEKEITFYRGEADSAGEGNYYTTSKQFANEFSGGQELTEVVVSSKDIYRPEKIGFAGNEKDVTRSINEAKEKGFKAVYLSEGKPFGEPIESIFVFDKSALDKKSVQDKSKEIRKGENLLTEKGDFVFDERSGEVREITSGNAKYVGQKREEFNIGTVRMKAIGDEKDYIGYANQMRPATQEEINQAKGVKEPKKKETRATFTRGDRAKIQTQTKDVLFSGNSQEELVSNIEEFFKKQIKVPRTTWNANKLKAIRAEARRSMFEMVGANTGNWKRDFALFQSVKNNPDLEKAIEAIENGIADIDQALEKSSFAPATAPSGFADVGGYADIESTEKRLKQIKSIELPELVRIARNLTGFIPDVKNLRSGKGMKTLGRFYSQNNGYIKLNPDIFKDPVLTAKVMAHEMGHMTDYLDDRTMARGNLLGRITSLKKFMRKTFTDFETENKISELTAESKALTAERRLHETGTVENKKLLKQIKKVNAEIKKLRKKTTISQETIFEELKSLTQRWKPFDEDAVPVSYVKYRYSAPELYADAVSVLFNDPDLLKAEAPEFWKAFFKNLNQKPKVAENLYGIWDLLNQGQAEILDQRAKDVREMFDKGEDKFMAMVKERRNRDEDYVFKIKYELIDKNQALIDKVNELKKAGTPVPDEQNPVYWLEEHNYVGGLVKNWVGENIDPIYKRLRENDLTWEDVGEVLFHERVVNERGAVSNVLSYLEENAPDLYDTVVQELPKGVDTLSVTKQLEILKQEFGNTMSADGTSLYDEIVAILPQGIANPLGFDVETSKKQLEFLKESLGDRYKIIDEILPDYRKAVQEVLKEAEKEGFYKPDLIKQMKANPAYATFQVLEYMDMNIPASIKQQVGTLKEIANPATSTVIKTISTIKAIERNKVKKKVVEFLKKNYPDEIIEAKTMFNGRTKVPIEPKDDKLSLFTTIENGKLVGYYIDPYIASTMEFTGTGHANAVLGVIRFFNSKLFRPLFITFNLGFQSFNLVRDFMRYYKNVPSATLFGSMRAYAKALPSAKARAFDIPDATIAEMEKSKILGITYNDVVKGFSEADKQIDAVIAKAGVSPLKTTKQNTFVKPFASVLEWIEKTGNMVETIPKVAGYRELNGKLPPKELGNYIRTKVGSPDFMRKGAGSAWYNEVFLFSNAIKEGIRSDIAVATDPKTRAGYWWKTAQVTFLPKIIMYAALAGLFGEGLKKLFENVSEYDMTNYVVIPMGEDENGNTVYLRVPQDETGRVLGGLFWKAMTIVDNREFDFSDVADLASYTGGNIPSLSPMFQSIFAVSQFVAGQNPYDFFRGREVIPDAEFQAGGKYALKPYLIWQFNQLGGGTFIRSYYSTQPPETKTLTQKVVEAPILSNIIGRWIKVSDYGQSEKNQKIVDEIEKESARERIETNRKVNKYIEQYRDGEASNSRKKDLFRELVKDVHGEAPYDSETKRKIGYLEKKYKLGIIKGESDEQINSLIYANTNDEKEALLNKMKKDMSESEYREFLGRLVDEKVISSNLAKKLWKQR